MAEVRLNGVIISCKLKQRSPAEEGPKSASRSKPDGNTSPFGLPACVRRILAEGVTSNQRVACFRVAVQLKRNGMPHDLTLVILKAWAQKNRPSNGKRIITDAEITRQAKCAFENTYRSFGCEDPAIAAYCDKDCPLYAYTVGKPSV